MAPCSSSVKEPSTNEQETFGEPMMNKTIVSVALSFAVAAAAVPARADEGMWTYNNVPRAQLKSKYGFEATDAWLDRVRLASVRFNSGGSGAFVSPDGLVLT